MLLTAAQLWHPPLPGRLPDIAGVAEAASAGITRWRLSQVAAALASGAVGLGLVRIGSTLYAMLPGMEFAVDPAHETGADLAETQTALESWFVPTLVVAAVTFASGTVLRAVGASADGIAAVGRCDRHRATGGRYPLTSAA